MTDATMTLALCIDFLASVCFFGGLWYLHRRCKRKREARFRALEGKLTHLDAVFNRQDRMIDQLAYRVSTVENRHDQISDRLAARVSIMEEILKNHTLDIEVPPPTNRREIYVD